jgi:PIN domain nuclease of toxin-antitoxin system
VRLLLDTHAFLWFIANDARLTSLARGLLEDESHDLLLSTASIWEIAIKISIGKLHLGGPIPVFIPQQLALNRIELLDINLSHLEAVSSLPRHHRDPFDRLIIAQAAVEQLPIISVDDKLDPYGIHRLW